MTNDGNELECLISQEYYILYHVFITFSIGSFISGKTADKWAVNIYSKNPKSYVTHYTVIHNNNMKFKNVINTCYEKYKI